MKYLIGIFLILFCFRAQTQETEVLAFDAGFGDLFGYSVAIDGNYAVVGAPLNGGFWSDNAGAAYVFQLIDDNWTYVKKLVPPNAGELGDQFGISVDISGNHIIVGAHQTDYHTKSNSGAAYIYSGSGTNWSLQATLFPQYAHPGDKFGASVGISEHWAIVGAPFHDGEGSSSGAAYVFHRGSYYGWVQKAKIVGSDTEADDVFGSAVAIDGETAVVGAPGNIGADHRHSGAVYIFRPDHYYNWNQVQRLTNSNPQWFDDFGASVDIEADYIIVGAPFRNDKRGSAYIFYDNGSFWMEQDEIEASDAETFDKFGNDVGITNGYAVVGMMLDDDLGTESGSMYLYEQSGTDWNEVGKFLASDGTQGDKFGTAVDIDGMYAISGAPYHTETELSQGSAYLFGPSFPIACASMVSLTGDIVGGEYMADDFITITGSILPDEAVTLSCSVSTEIHPSFTMPIGAQLTISTEGCQ